HLAQLAVRIAEQQEGEGELLREGLVLLDAVEAGAEHHDVLVAQLGSSIPEPLALDRSTRCVGLRVEPEHHVLASVVAEPHRAALVGGRGEVGGGFALLQERHVDSFPSRWLRANAHFTLARCQPRSLSSTERSAPCWASGACPRTGHSSRPPRCSTSAGARS